MAKKPRFSEEDQTVWALYLRSVQALPGRPPLAEPALPPAAVAAPPLLAPIALPPLRRGPTRLAYLAIGDQPSGLDSSSWLRFKSGKIAAVRKLDLHAHTVDQAYSRLRGFLAQAHTDRLRAVEIVTGRGSGPEGGVLRRELPLWLNLPDVRPMILAAAHPHAMNPGSVRLLLRRPK